MGQDRQAEAQRTSMLMVRYQGGDIEAFNELYRRLKPALFRYILSRVLDRSRAEDLLQETFLQIHRSRQTFLPGTTVPAWAIGVARHVCLMDLRRTGRRATHERLAEDTLPEIPVSGEAASFADREMLRKALALLPEDSREALIMYHFEGLSFKEIAGILGVGVEAAKVRAHRAAKALAALVTKLRGTKGDSRQEPLTKEPSAGGAT